MSLHALIVFSYEKIFHKNLKMPYSEKQCRLFHMMAAGKAEGSPPKDWRDYCTKEGKERVKRMSMDEYERHLNK